MKASILALAAAAATVFGQAHHHQHQHAHLHQRASGEGSLEQQVEKLDEPVKVQTTLVPVATPGPHAGIIKRDDYSKLGGQGNDPWAFTYVPYGGDGKGQTWCKKPDEIASDIGQIASKNIKTVRIYSTDDCDQLSAVHSACQQHNIKMIIGVFFKDAGGCESDLTSQLKIITGYFSGKYDDVELITVGNECISAGTCNPGQLAGLISTAKETLKGAGYAGPVSTALIVGDWLNHKADLCPVVDAVAAQIHPFFSDQTVAPGDSGSYFESQYEQAQGACGGSKPVICTETGWPKQGGSYKGQTAGVSQQAQAIGSLKKNKYVSKTVFFANADDLWKYNQEAYEMYFGCLDQF